MTTIEIDGEDFLIDGQPTYAGRTWNGHRVERPNRLPCVKNPTWLQAAKGGDPWRLNTVVANRPQQHVVVLRLGP